VGLLASLAAAILWAISGVCGKLLLSGALSPARLVFYRCALATLLLFVILLLRDPLRLGLKQRDFAFFVAMGTLGLALTQFTYYSAIQVLSVGLAILLQYLAPLWILLFERFYLKLPLTRSRLVALGLALAGCSLVSLETIGSAHLGGYGIALGVAAGIFLAAYSLMAQHASKSYADLTVLFYSLLFATFFWAIVGPESWQPLSQIETFNYWIVAYVAAFGTIVPYLLFIRALRYLTASQVGIATTAEPVAAAVIAWVFLAERLSSLQIAGGLCVLGAIVLLHSGSEVRIQNEDSTSIEASGGNDLTNG
jgi:drug/metabolite transporter (DMT)-like permease